MVVSFDQPRVSSVATLRFVELIKELSHRYVVCGGGLVDVLGLATGLADGLGDDAAWGGFTLGGVVVTGGSGPLGPALGFTREQLAQSLELT